VKAISLVINGRPVDADVEPRMHLADFLREHQNLTATHIGCEHGVCGACTVLIDGAPARSCITFAVAADRAEVTTLEAFDADPVMTVVREAFSEHHGLQCGFCTPGMLMMARDVLIRLPDADEKRIRLELSGNLCRCTGYVGIIRAIRSAQNAIRNDGSVPRLLDRGLGPVGAHPPAAERAGSERPLANSNVQAQSTEAAIGDDIDLVDWGAVERDGVALHQSFSVPFARSDIWRFFSDLGQVVRCMPGARLTKPEQNQRAEGEVNVRLGPIAAAFRGTLQVERDDASFRGQVKGAGRDAKSPTSARAIIAYQVRDETDRSARVDVSIRFILAGALSQFSRAGLIKDAADHLTKQFAANLEKRLSGHADDSVEEMEALDMRAVAQAAIGRRVRLLIDKILGR